MVGKLSRLEFMVEREQEARGSWFLYTCPAALAIHPLLVQEKEEEKGGKKAQVLLNVCASCTAELQLGFFPSSGEFFVYD